MNDAKPAADIAASHHDSLFRWALTLTARDFEEARDVVQQVYVEVLEGRVDLSGAHNPRAFLFGVARRVAASRRRRRAIWGRISDLVSTRGQEISAPVDPETAAAAGQMSATMLRALDMLPKKQRQVLVLVFAEEMTVEQAAAVMGVSVGSARTHYHRAKQRLGRILEGETDGRKKDERAAQKSA